MAYQIEDLWRTRQRKRSLMPEERAWRRRLTRKRKAAFRRAEQLLDILGAANAQFVLNEDELKIIIYDENGQRSSARFQIVKE